MRVAALEDVAPLLGRRFLSESGAPLAISCGRFCGRRRRSCLGYPPHALADQALRPSHVHSSTYSLRTKRRAAPTHAVFTSAGVYPGVSASTPGSAGSTRLDELNTTLLLPLLSCCYHCHSFALYFHLTSSSDRDQRVGNLSNFRDSLRLAAFESRCRVELDMHR